MQELYPTVNVWNAGNGVVYYLKGSENQELEIQEYGEIEQYPSL